VLRSGRAQLPNPLWRVVAVVAVVVVVAALVRVQVQVRVQWDLCMKLLRGCVRWARSVPSESFPLPSLSSQISCKTFI
jgi:hypothetical protein